MRILLIAYEFPPSASPQALRWAYLSRELAANGHEVHVLTADIGASANAWPTLPEGVRIHRTFAGPFRGLLAARQTHKHRAQMPDPHSTATGDAEPLPVNWKYRLVEIMQRTLAQVLFPDERAEWRPWAGWRLTRLLKTICPDVVIASHEPATSLQLGLRAKREGFPLIADLGDPILAPYTPRHWQRKAERLEREVCAQADRVIVTTLTTQQLLADRHARHNSVTVLTQGYDDSATLASDPIGFDPDRLELLYTGNFYRFRRVDELITAIGNVDGVRLTIATPAAPPSLLAASRDDPTRFRLLGMLPHARVLSLQRKAHVLVHIANDHAVQIPGKLYEYLGTGRPILYLGADDPIATALLRRSGAGWVVGNDALQIRERLTALLDLHGGDGLPAAAPVAEFSWRMIASRLQTLLDEVVNTPVASATDPRRR